MTGYRWGMHGLDESRKYYRSLREKWESDYPSAESIEKVWAFYEECGYTDPIACFTRILDHMQWTQRNVLDFGCDNGIMLNLIHELCPDADCFGIDINGYAIKKAAEMFPKLHFSEFDGVSIPFENRYFDLVFVSAVLKHIRYEDRNQLYSEFCRTSRYVFVVEVDSKEMNEVNQNGWTFYLSNFREELERFFEPVEVFSEAGDLWGLYRTNEDLPTSAAIIDS